MKIQKLTNEYPDSVDGESSAGPIELAKKINEIIEKLNDEEKNNEEKNENFKLGSFCGKFKKDTIVVPVEEAHMIFEIFKPHLLSTSPKGELKYYSDKYRIFIEMVY